MSVRNGVHGHAELVVGDADTAASLRCGDVAVLGTPRIVSLCEEASIDALAGQLTAEQTSVGSQVEVAHLTPVAVGSTVRATATLERCEGRRLVFSVSVSDDCGLVAAGKITRVVVDRSYFMQKAR